MAYYDYQMTNTAIYLNVSCVFPDEAWHFIYTHAAHDTVYKHLIVAWFIYC